MEKITTGEVQIVNEESVKRLRKIAARYAGYRRLYHYECSKCGKSRYTRKFFRFISESCTKCQKAIVDENQLSLLNTN